MSDQLRKAGDIGVFCCSVFHTEKFSTGVDNFVENVTHRSSALSEMNMDALRLIVYAFRRCRDACHVSKNASCQKPLAFFLKIVYHIGTQEKHTAQRGV